MEIYESLGWLIGEGIFYILDLFGRTCAFSMLRAERYPQKKELEGEEVLKVRKQDK